MFAWSPDFQKNYNTANPYAPGGVISYTNETNVAQARPLQEIGVLAPGGGLVGTAQEWRPQPTSAPTPTNPAAPNPVASPAASDAQKKQNPVVWIGLAAGILVILWALR
jgi:hypothetical protein